MYYIFGHSFAGGYGAMVARLTPDQTVGRSNRSGLIFFTKAENFWATTALSKKGLPGILHLPLWPNG